MIATRVPDRLAQWARELRTAPGWAAVLLVAAISFAARQRSGRAR